MRGGPATMRARRVLTVAQVALAVVLLLGGVLYARTYLALLALDKGFASRHIVGIDLTLPTAAYAGQGSTSALLDQAMTRLRARADVQSVSRLPGSIFDAGTTLTSLPEVDDHPPATEPMSYSLRTVDASFFETMALTAQRGRLFGPGEAPTNIVITPTLARRFWPEENPVGRRVRTAPTQPWLTVIGVVNHLRYASEIPGDRYGSIHQIYVPPAPSVPHPSRPVLTHITEAQPAPAPRPLGPNVPRSGAIYMFLSFAARLDPKANVADLYRDLREIDSKFALTIKPVDAVYAEVHHARLLAARTVGAFAVLAFIVCVAGLYGVMAYLVSARNHEFGIRLALGAARSQIRRSVLGSALRLVGLGVAIGLLAAFSLAQWIQSQLHGVTATDPATYVGVTVAVFAATAAAASIPARRASRVDPMVSLRAE
jgi:hypothetical protein